MSEENKTILAKVNVTSDLTNWWECDLSDVFVTPEKVTIISAVVDRGGLYLIYTYKTNNPPTL
jgi:hypothetical protein